jgi:hypothetical protein
MFTYVEDCEVESHIEKGKWWVKDGLFYETSGEDQKPDIYEVEMLDDSNVKFKAKQLTTEFDNKVYEFFEIRQE